MDLEKRFWDKVQKTDGCWQWIAGKFKQGYGSFYFKGRHLKAHRVAWELSFGQIPESQKVCHSCDNPACMNPSHLFIGSQKDNIRDMMAKGRSSTVGASQAGENNRNARLTKGEVLNIRNSILPSKVLAELYPVSLAQIYNIKNGSRWAFGV